MSSIEAGVNKRTPYIDIARAIGIFLVVFGHVITGKLTTIIYWFHMPFFFFLSGLLLKRKSSDFSKRDLFYLLIRRTYNYYIPYVIWGLFYSRLTLKNLLKLLWGTREVLVQIESLTSLWFLPTLLFSCIVCELVLFAIRKKKNQRNGIILSCVSCFSIGFGLPRIDTYGWPFSANIGFVAAGFMLAGFLFKELLNEDVCLRKSLELTIVYMILMIATVFCLPSNEVSMYMGSYGNIPIFIVRAFSFSFFFVYLSLLLTHTTHIKQILLFIGQNTLGIMVIHKPIVLFFRDFVIQNGFSSSSIIVALAISFLGAAISLVINQILRLTVPVLIGRDEVKMIQKRTKQ